ncbi:MAG: hypothetical protein U5K72_00325 [Balneolaceae bacterium]|nr:hypothetical protein [Balneolaceae bacterium]
MATEAKNICSPTLTSIIFDKNSAESGGAIYNQGINNGESSPIITNSLFTNNNAQNSGGAINNVGLNSGDSSPIITNSTFFNNTADLSGFGFRGGAISNEGSNGKSSPMIRNTILFGNNAGAGNEIGNLNASPNVRYSLVQGGCPTDTNCGDEIYNYQ